jgi:tetratricopeptide (TPR) repeat protein
VSAEALRTEVLELLAEVRLVGRGAFRSKLDAAIDGCLPRLVAAHDPYADGVLSSGFRDQLFSAVSQECLRVRQGSLPRAEGTRPRNWTWGWSLAAAAAILIAFLVYTFFVSKRDLLAPKDRSEITGPQVPIPRIEPLRPQGPTVQKSPDVRSDTVPRKREKEQERVVVREQEPVVGTLVAGEPLVRDVNGRLIAVKRGVELRRGWIVDAGDLGSVEILLKDGSRLTLYFNTVLVLKGGSGRDFEMRSGRIYANVTRTEGLDKFVVETPVATAEVLGTEFGLSLERKAKQQAVLQVKSGRVAFYNTFGSIEAGAMTESTAVQGAKPTEPRRIANLRTYSLNYGNDYWYVSVNTSQLTLDAARHYLIHPTGSTGLITNGRPGQPLRAVEVLHGSAAAQAGLKTGDVLLAIDGHRTAARRAGKRHLFRPLGRPIRVLVQRGEVQREFSVVPTAGQQATPKLSRPWASRLSQASDLLLKGEFDRSKSLLGELAAESGEAAAFNNLAVAYEIGDDMTSAIRLYKQAVMRDPDVPKYRLNLGLALQKIGNHRRSIEEMEEAVSLDPSCHDAILFLARAYSLVDRVEDALKVLDDGAKLDPSCPHFDHARSITFMKASRYQEAAEADQRAASMEPNLASMHGQLGRSLRLARRIPEAEAALRKALELDPAEVTHWGDLGTLLMDIRRFDLAEETLRKGIELDPGSSNLRNKLGLTFARTGRYPEAEREFREAVRHDPKSANAMVNLAGVLLNQTRHRDAEEMIFKAIAIEPKVANAYAVLGNIYFRSQRYGLAEEPYRQAARLDPGQILHTNMLVQTLLLLNRPKEAEEARRTFVELNPNRPDGHRELSHFLSQRERFEEAADVARQAAELFPNDGETHIDLGYIYMNLRKLPEAEAALRKGIQLAPRNPIGYSNLGGVLYDLGRFAEAEPMFRKAAELQPRNPQWPQELAMIMEKLNRPAEALQMNSKAAELDPTNPEWPYQRARLLERLNRPDDAERMYRKAVELKPGSHVVHDDLAHFLDRAGRPLEAVEAYGAAAIRNVTDPHQWSEYGWSLIAVHRWEEALTAYRKCFEIDPKGDLALNSKNNIGFALIHLSRLGEAETVLSEALKIKSGDEEARSNWAYLLAHQGRDLDEALKLARATTKSDSHAQRHLVLGFAHLKRGEFTDAIEPLSRAADGFGKAFLAADAWVFLGQVHEARKDVPAAIAAYRRALQIEAGNKPAADAIKRLGG